MSADCCLLREQFIWSRHLCLCARSVSWFPYFLVHFIYRNLLILNIYFTATVVCNLLTMFFITATRGVETCVGKFYARSLSCFSFPFYFLEFIQFGLLNCVIFLAYSLIFYRCKQPLQHLVCTHKDEIKLINKKFLDIAVWKCRLVNRVRGAV